MSDLLYSDTEEALRDSVRRLFADRCPTLQQHLLGKWSLCTTR